MNLIIIATILLSLGAVGWIFWDKAKSKAKLDFVTVIYSERVGNNIIEHDKQYLGTIDYANDIFKVPAINLLKPIPPSSVYISTKAGKKKINIIKIDTDRIAFRVPSMDNQVYVPQRDEYGNLIKNSKGKPLLKKYHWQFCDDVVEPDVKHWNQNITEKLRQKHRLKSDLLTKWIMPIMMGMLLITGVIVMQISAKTLKENQEYTMESIKQQITLAGEVEIKAKENTGLINNIIKRLDEKEKRQD